LCRILPTDYEGNSCHFFVDCFVVAIYAAAAVVVVVVVVGGDMCHLETTSVEV